MIRRGQLGSKSREHGGFYGRQNGSRPVWNPRRETHETPEAAEHDFVVEVRALLRDGLYAPGVQALFGATGEAAKLVQKQLANYVHYASRASAT
jgi:hypothetical protein